METHQGARLVTVVAAVLLDDVTRLLLSRRPLGKAFGGLWEFPGGKIEPGETPEAALVRELNEELGITISADTPEPLIFISHAYEASHLLMPVYVCRTWSGTPQPLEGQELAWVSPAELDR